MIGIGEFSHGTGLSIKTLRYYHDIGLLPAANVDELNGYRSYRAEQLQHAALLRLLRATGMGITQMKQALTHPHDLPGILEERRRELAAQRELEDWALDQALRWQQPIGLDQVQRRECPAQHWVGTEATIDLKELGEDPDESVVEQRFDVLQHGFEELLERLSDRGVDALTDTFWMSFGSDSRQSNVLRVSYCLQTKTPVRPDINIEGVDVVTGQLPTRTEAFVTTPVPTAEQPTDEDLVAARLPGGPLPHPTGLALSLVAEQAGVDSTPVRQRTTGTPERPVIEHCLTLSVH